MHLKDITMGNRILTHVGGRLDYIDIAKSLGMLTIIWGHVRLGDWSNAFVYAWHIPLFFVLSGMVFDKNRYANFSSFLLKKVKSLLIPYVIFSFLTWVIWAVFSFIVQAPIQSYWMPLAQTFIAQGSGGFLVHNVPLWFVTCLFVMELLYYFIADLRRSWIIIVTILLAALSYCLITYWTGWDVTLLPWNLEVACLGLPFYAVGHLIVQKWGHQSMQEKVSSHRGISVLLIMFLAVVVIIGSNYNGSISFGHSDLGKNVFVSYACAFFGVSMMIIVSMLLTVSSWNQKDTLLMKVLKWFGRNSFIAMVIHNPIKGIVSVLVGKIFQCSVSVVSHNYLYSSVVLVITLVVTMFGIIIINWFEVVFKKRIEFRRHLAN